MNISTHTRRICCKLRMKKISTSKLIENEKRRPIVQTRRNNRIIFIVWVFTILNITLFISTVVISVRRLTTGQTGPSDDQKVGNFCVNCGDLEPGIWGKDRSELDAFRQTDGDDAMRRCCAHDANRLEAMLNLLIEAGLRTEKAKGNLVMERDVEVGVSNLSQVVSAAKPAAHFVGADFTKELNQDTRYTGNPYKIRKWNYDHSLAFHRNGVDYRDGCIIIPKSGLYYVYSQVYFLDAQEESHAGRDPLIDHYIYREKLGGPEEKLLENAQTTSVGQSDVLSHLHYTSFLGGVVHLRVGEGVMVKVSNASLLTSDEFANYFGLLMV